MKRGQVAIFIIVGIVLVFSVVAIFVSVDLIKTPKSSAFSDNIYSAISFCLEKSGEAAVSAVLAQGGVYEKGSSNDFQIYKLAKPVSEGDDLGEIEKSEEYEFTKENVGENIGFFIDDIFGECLDDVKLIDFGEEVVFGEFVADVDAGSRYVIVDLDFPVTISKGNESMYVDSFTYKRKVALGVMDNVVNQIVDESVENNEVPYELIENLEEEYNVDISWVFLSEEYLFKTVIFMMSLPGEEAEVNFVIEYDWEGDSV